LSVLSNFAIDVIIFLCVYLIFTLSLNLEQGYSGMANLGLYFPILIGAILVGYLPGTLGMLIYNLRGTNLVDDNMQVLSLLQQRLQADVFMSMALLAITIGVALAVGWLAGYLAAYPALRLPEIYLAVFLLSLGETLRVVAGNSKYPVGGTLGVNTINPFWFLYENSYLGLVAFIAATTIVVAVVYELICKSPVGRMLRGMRENELTAACTGKNVPQIKKHVLGYTFAILALGGALHAFYLGGIVASGYGRSDFSYWPWLMMIVGGTGNNKGIFLGTLSIVLMRRAMIASKSYFLFLPFNVLWLEPLLMALMLGLTIAYRPGGLLPEKPSKIPA
jgi:branched-chain amino acid transport system permease protein